MMQVDVSIPEARFTVDGVFTPEECAQTIAWAEDLGFEEAPITTARGFVRIPSVRNNTRVMVDHTDLAADLWARVQPEVPASLGPWRAVGLNERLRIYRYGEGQYFKPHLDGAFARSSTERSQFTMMVYLNDDFTGGETAFTGQLVRPAPGRALFFLHRQRHEGRAVRSGLKYVLRTDVMYRR